MDFIESLKIASETATFPGNAYRPDVIKMETMTAPNHHQYTAEQVWGYVLSQLQLDMSRSNYETWVKSTQAISIDGQTLTIGCHNQYGREWLENRLTSTVQRLVSGMVGHLITVKFLVIDCFDEPMSNAENENRDDLGIDVDTAILEPVFASIRDAIIEPDRVVKMPLYFLRWLPYVGAKTIFETLGFWQEYYLSSKGKYPAGGEKVSTRIERVCTWSGVSRAQLFRDLGDGQPLYWFLKKIDTDYERDRNSGRAKKSANKYLLYGISLTPGDAEDLKTFLLQNGIQTDPAQALRIAIEAQPNKILEYPVRKAKESTGKLIPSCVTVQEIVRDLIGRRMDQGLAELADLLADRLLAIGEFILIRWYFLTHWLPLLGHNPAMLVILLRNLCYFNDQTGEIRDEVWIENGYTELANRIGLENSRQLVQWFPAMFERGGQVDFHTEKTERELERRSLVKNHLAQFIERVDCRTSGHSSYGWQFRVQRMDPLIPEHQIVKEAAGVLFAQAEDQDVLEPLYTFINWLPNDCYETLKKDPMIVLRLSKTENDCIETLRMLLNDCFETVKPLSNGCFETLLKTLKAFKDSQIIKDTPSNQDSSHFRRTLPGGQVGGWDQNQDWKLETLLETVSDQVRETLIQQEKSPYPFLSWILYGIATPTIQNPASLAISKLKSNPGKGAGGAYDRVARLPADEFVRNLLQEMTLWRPSDPDWRTLFQSIEHTRKKTLFDILSVPDPEITES